MRNRSILFLILVVMGAGPVWGQTIASASMTLIDNDDNGFANIGDAIEISVVVDGAVTGTSVRIFNSDLFESPGPYNLSKITPGFGDGIEYAITLPIGPGGSHDGVPASAVQFLVQVRLGGVTMDDLTNLTIDGITELIDNVPPVVDNAVFSGEPGVLITGDDFQAGVDASDGSGVIEVTANLSRLGLDDSVSIPHQGGETWLLDTEQIQEALTSDQVSLAQDRSIVFTVTDAAGNATVHDSASDSQVRTVDNVSPPAPEFLAVQRATWFNASEDLFDLVITDGPDPTGQNGSPLLDESGQPITYSDLMAGGTFDVYWSVGGQPFELLTTTTYSANGSLVQLNLPFSEFAESKLLEFQVEPVKNSTLAGEPASDSTVIQRGVVEAIIVKPEDGYVVGNGLEVSLSSSVTQPVGPLADFAVEPNYRLYFRDVANPGVIDSIDLVAGPDGTFIQDIVLSANDFVAAGFGSEVDVVVRPSFQVNGVTLRNLTPALAFQNNPVIRIEIDPDLLGDTIFLDRFEVLEL
jgi:hypothetical protein